MPTPIAPARPLHRDPDPAPTPAGLPRLDVRMQRDAIGRPLPWSWRWRVLDAHGHTLESGAGGSQGSALAQGGAALAVARILGTTVTSEAF